VAHTYHCHQQFAAFFKNYQEVSNQVEQPENKASEKTQEKIQRIRITELLE